MSVLKKSLVDEYEQIQKDMKRTRKLADERKEKYKMANKQIQIPVNDLKDKVIIIKQGQPIVLDKPASGYGEHTITWVDGKITADRVSYTNKR